MIPEHFTFSCTCGWWGFAVARGVEQQHMRCPKCNSLYVGSFCLNPNHEHGMIEVHMNSGIPSDRP